MSTENENTKPVNFKGERIKMALRLPADTKERLEYLQAEWGIDTQGELVDAALRHLEEQTRAGLRRLEIGSLPAPCK
ncbi:MAG: hypothetical protein V4723_03115 [Pseudomonadota bacterium]